MRPQCADDVVQPAIGERLGAERELSDDAPTPVWSGALLTYRHLVDVYDKWFAQARR